MKTSDFFYELPQRLIAQHPLAERDHSRLLHWTESGPAELSFFELPNLLRSGDCLVLNNTKVIPARLIGAKTGSGAAVEILLLQRLDLKSWKALVKPGKRLKAGARVQFIEGRLEATVKDYLDDGQRLVEFDYAGVWESLLDEAGRMPLPPYIHEQLADQTRYQTVYASQLGSAAAPTAGLHFTPELLRTITEKSVDIVYLTLHVGLGTFRPVKSERVEDHLMHSEYYELDEAAADCINARKAKGGRIIAVGTTSCRVLESLADERGMLRAARGWTDIFIYPGYRFKCIDALITNFHLPESSLIMLVSALAGYEKTMAAYRYAVEREFRFFSFGDAMFVERAALPEVETNRTLWQTEQGNGVMDDEK